MRDITLEVRKDTVVIELHGMRKIAAMKSKLSFKIDNIVGVSRIDHDAARRIKDQNMNARVFATFDGGRHRFYNVLDAYNAILITLKDEPYDRIYISVPNAEKSIRKIRRMAEG